MTSLIAVWYRNNVVKADRELPRHETVPAGGTNNE